MIFFNNDRINVMSLLYRFDEAGKIKYELFLEEVREINNCDQ